MTYYININRQTIAANAKHGRNDPPVSYRKGKSGKSTYCYRLKIENGELIYSPHKAILKCGARLVIRTDTKPQIIR